MSDSLIPRAVIFDWDNTLVDSWGAIGEAINFVRARYGLQTWTPDEIIANCTRSARESFPDWFGDKWPEAWDIYYAEFDKVRTRIGISPMNGAVELLAWLKASHIPAMVVSNKSGDYLRQECSQLGWDGYFEALAGAHDAPRDKPAREHADHALKLAGILPGDDVWFVGDSEADMVCARNAGCTPVLVGHKNSAGKWGSERYFGDCAQLLALLSRGRRAIA
jgi:phosphoglycolate phosphatase